jgi:hypothetical protein
MLSIVLNIISYTLGWPLIILFGILSRGFNHAGHYVSWVALAELGIIVAGVYFYRRQKRSRSMNNTQSLDQ